MGPDLPDIPGHSLQEHCADKNCGFVGDEGAFFRSHLSYRQWGRVIPDARFRTLFLVRERVVHALGTSDTCLKRKHRLYKSGA